MNSAQFLLGAMVAVCLAGLPQGGHAFSLEGVVDGWMGEDQPNIWIAQLDGDAALEVITVHRQPNRILITDGSTHAVEFSHDAMIASQHIACTTADIDGDGLLEVLVAVADTWPGDARTFIIATDVTVGLGDAPMGDVVSPSGARSYPNPSMGPATIQFDVPEATTATIRVFDAQGRLVRTLAENAVFDAGPHEIHWNGKDNGSNAVATGEYFYQVATAGGVQAKKMIVLR